MRRQLVALLVLALAGCGQLWGGACLLPRAEALLILHDLAAGASRSQFKAMTPAPSRTGISYQVAGRNYRGDLYMPAVAPAAGLVLLPGAAKEGKEDSRIIAFANTLSRARFVVLVPDMQGVRGLQVRPEDAQEVADAFRYLVSQERLSPGGRAGMAAVSYAVGPAILAALEPDLREQVDLVLAVGGYYSLLNVLTFVTTGEFRAPGGPWQTRAVNPYGLWVFVDSNLEYVHDADDRARLREMAKRRLADPEANIEDLTRDLGPEGQTVYAFVTARTPLEVEARFERLPPDIQAGIVGLDVARRDLSQLSTRLVLVHGVDDPIIPYTESIRLAQAAPHSQLYLVSGLMHVNLGGLSLEDMRLLGCALDALLALRQ